MRLSEIVIRNHWINPIPRKAVPGLARIRGKIPPGPLGYPRE